MGSRNSVGLGAAGTIPASKGTAEWPDGTVAARYGFLHALYQEVLYHRLTVRRRQRLHRQIGEQTSKPMANEPER